MFLHYKTIKTFFLCCKYASRTNWRIRFAILFLVKLGEIISIRPRQPFSFLITFRPLLKKKKASMKTGAGADEVFRPIWFAFEAMEGFFKILKESLKRLIKWN